MSFSFSFLTLSFYSTNKPDTTSSVVTALWWAFVLGFLCASFYLMYTILYSGDESAKEPYFVRNQNKYPDILPQPGLAISCVSTSPSTAFSLQGNKTCTVTINKMFRWKPEVLPTLLSSQPFDESDPELTLYKRKIKMKERLVNLRLVATGDTMLVTCLGADKEDDEQLDGGSTHPPATTARYDAGQGWGPH